MTLPDRLTEFLASADAVMIAAGAGMGVDSGMPDFRGPQGFWKAYPAYEKLGFNFQEMANPRHFRENPELGWGFYGHRSNLYRDLAPHSGFNDLLIYARARAKGFFVLTTNVDGHFQKAGFPSETMLEIHGSIHHHQCLEGCGYGIWKAPKTRIEIDESSMRARPPLPTCPGCGSLARPNILMFGDGEWEEDRSAKQAIRFRQWREYLPPGDRLALIELGAGTALPTLRHQMEHEARHQPDSSYLIRINPRESAIPGDITRRFSLPCGAREALAALLPGVRPSS
ncbi:MAG: Sir2 family NAD-dependent protein deacetylase [Verrucomicrobiota bacterium]